MVPWSLTTVGQHCFLITMECSNDITCLNACKFEEIRVFFRTPTIGFFCSCLLCLSVPVPFSSNFLFCLSTLQFSFLFFSSSLPSPYFSAPFSSLSFLLSSYYIPLTYLLSFTLSLLLSQFHFILPSFLFSFLYLSFISHLFTFSSIIYIYLPIFINNSNLG